MSEPNDAELVEAARSGDAGSFGELYRRHYASAFAIACRDLGRLRRTDRFAGWLGAICRNVASRVARKQLQQRLPEDAHVVADGNPGDDRREVVRQSVQRLPRSAKEVIVLHYFSGLTYEQIASSLDISPQAVHGRLIRARRILAEDLRRNGLGRREP